MLFWRTLFRSRAVRISLAAILLVPLLYSYLYLWAFWDPYGRLSDLPVAVVNEDRGASYMGETVNIGAELIDKLRDDPVMNWVFLSRREADQALEDGRVYLALIIPPDFSARAVRVDDPQALRAALVLKTNPAQNLLASQIGESAVRQLHQKLSETLTERFVAAILETVEKGAAGLDTAADAARQLENGTRQAKSGAQTLADGAHELDRGAVVLQAGAVRLAAGGDRLVAGLAQSADGAARLREGADRLATGTADLQTGARQLASGHRELADGLERAAAGSTQLAKGAQEVAQGLTRLEQGAGELAHAAGQLGDRLTAASGGAQQLAQALEAWARARGVAGDPQLAALQRELAALSAGLGQAASGAQRLAAETAQLHDGAVRLLAGQRQVADGATQLADRLAQAAAGSAALADGSQRLAQGADRLAAGAQQLAAGHARWADGQKQLASGAQTLQGGLREAAAGADRLAAGTTRLAQGADALDRGLARLADGQRRFADAMAEKAKDAQEAMAHRETVAERVARPVDLAVEKRHDVPDYGTGFAPYFVSLSLFVGALLLFLVADPRKVAAFLPPVRWAPVRWVAARYAFYALAAGAQALIVSGAFVGGLGLKPALPGWYVLTNVVTAFCFAALVFLLLVAFGEAGRFLGIVLLMLQLTSCAGTFPLEMQPAFFQAISPYLPMTYAVAAMKAAVSAGDAAKAWTALAVLGAFTVGFLVLTVLAVTAKRRSLAGEPVAEG